MSLVSFLFGKSDQDPKPDDPVQQALGCAGLEELKHSLGHRSGYVREVAIERVVSLRCEGAIPAVMPRLNDHVWQVRDGAKRAIQTLLPFAGLDDLLAFLGYTWRLRHFSRCDHREWIAAVQSDLARQLTIGQLREALASDALFVVRGSFFLLLERGLVPRAELLALAIASRSDVFIARHAAGLASSLPVQERIIVLEAGMRSHFGAVRTLALRGLLECAPNADDVARGALLDTQGSVRSSAQYHLRNSGFDLAVYYRAVLQDPAAKVHVSTIAIAALGSLGTAEDIALLRKWSASPYPSNRAAAFLAWLKLAPADKDDIAISALVDESRSVRKLAASMATRQGAFIPFERVRELLRGKRDLAILFAFARLRKWDWIDTIADEAMQSEPGSREWGMLLVQMERWLRHAGQAYELLTEAQRERLSSPEVLLKLERLSGSNRATLRHELGLNTKC